MVPQQYFIEIVEAIRLGIVIGESALSLGGRWFDSDPSRVQPSTLQMARAAFLLDTQHLGDRAWTNPVVWNLMGKGKISP